MGTFWFCPVSAICQKTLVFLVFPVLAVHKPYYFLYFSPFFFLSRIPWFSLCFLQGLSPNHIIPCTKPMVQIPAGVFSHERATRLFFYFMSCLCRHMVGLHTVASVVLHRSACGSRPLVQTFLETFPVTHHT